MALDATVFLFGSALVAGLLSSPHCVGMCGSVMAAAHNVRGVRNLRPIDSANGSTIAISSIGLASVAARPVTTAFTDSLVFNAGRIASYVAAGTVAGFISSSVATTNLFGEAMLLRTSLYIVGQLMVIVMGLYIAGWPSVLIPLERLGHTLWRHLSPIASRHLQQSTSGQASVRSQFTLGVLWGWIPCGLVYAMLASALASQHAVDGALTMLGFGLGTLPAMMLVGVTLARMRTKLQDKRLRAGVGAIFVVVGVVNLSHASGFSKLSAYGMVCHQLGLGATGAAP
jgi:uncharacterized protein